MTFFNKKTEVMQIEMTPYGRYLYSIGKFKPHTYEFVDDDISYRVANSQEAQEAAHQRILNETPKLKINRAYQYPVELSTSPISNVNMSVKREPPILHNQKQNGLYAMARSSYSSDKLPNFQVSMLRGEISSSSAFHEVNSSPSGLTSEPKGGSIFIPQVNINFNINSTVKNVLNEPREFKENVSKIFSDGSYVELSFEDPIIHLKEFNSFYENENFDIEFFEVLSAGRLAKRKILSATTRIINDMLIEKMTPDSNSPNDADELSSNYDHEAVIYDDSFFEYFFFIENDETIPNSEICKVVDSLEVNDQFIDEELVCPDRRTDRFDIYATRVGPDDLEDCD